MKAARKGNAEKVENLLGRGASLEAVDRKGRTALDLAKQYDREEVVAAIEAEIEDKAYEAAEAQDTLVAYGTFLTDFPDGRRAADALARVAQLDFEFAKETNSIAGFNGFIAKHPDRNQLVIMAESSVFALAYQEATAKNTIAAYEGFLAAYPSAPQAMSAKATIEWFALDWQDEEKLQDFLSRYPAESYSQSAKYLEGCLNYFERYVRAFEKSAGSAPIKKTCENVDGHARIGARSKRGQTNLIFEAKVAPVRKTDLSCRFSLFSGVELYSGDESYPTIDEVAAVKWNEFLRGPGCQRLK